MNKRTVKPYIVNDSGRSVNNIMEEINSAVFANYRSKYKELEGARGIVINPLCEYEKLLASLKSNNNIEFVPFFKIHELPRPEDKIRCFLRHDVDIDIRTALTLARIEKSFGISSTWFILHTSLYYGVFNKGIFLRNDCMAHVYREIQDLGHEIALHTDGLLIYQKYKRNGAEAITTEIDWLRRNGINICGTVAHNSASTYGAENYSIFKGRTNKLYPGDPDQTRSGESVNDIKEIFHNGKWSPLQVLDESELGLIYEGNEIFWQNEVPVEYGATRGVNAWRWNLHLKRQETLKDPAQRWFYDQERMLHDIHQLEPGRYLVLSVHPVYYGSRHCPLSGPAKKINRSSKIINDDIGWETYKPDTLQCQALDVDDDQEFQSINNSNEYGMLDELSDLPQKDYALRILLLGGTNIDGFSVNIPAQMQIILRDLLETEIKQPVKIWKLAFPGMGICRYYSWFQKICDKITPHIVILGIGADEAMNSLPEYWSCMTGFNIKYPCGDYLNWNGDTVELIERSKAGMITRKNAIEKREVISFSVKEYDSKHMQEKLEYADVFIGKCAEYFIEKIRKQSAHTIFLLQECGEHLNQCSFEYNEKIFHTAYINTKTWLSNLAGKLDIDVIDPYKRYLESKHRIPMHWKSINQWNYTGHRIAAEESFHKLQIILTNSGFNRLNTSDRD